MQKKLIALAIAGLSGAAFAQSNVTISGQFKVGVDSISATGSSAATPVLQAAANYTSRTRVVDNNSNLRFAGTEDLGGGMKAFFQVESALGTSDYDGTGSGNTSGTRFATLGSRDTFVGVSGNWGSFSLGKHSIHYNAMANVEAAGLADGLALVTSSLDLLNTINGTTLVASTRLTNAMQYNTPNFGGFTGQLTYGTGAEATTPLLAKKDNNLNLKLSYNNGPIAATYSYLAANGAGAAAPVTAVAGVAATVVQCINNATGAITTVATVALCTAVPGTVLVSNAVTAVAGLTGNGSDVRSNRLGAAYTFPMGLKVGLIWDKSKNTNKTAVTGDTWIDRSAWILPVSYKTGAHTISFTYGKTNSSGADAVTGAARAVGYSDSAKMTMLGWEYAMSKRTSVAASWTQINNDNNAMYDFWHPSSNVANGGGVANAGTDPRAFSMNLTHKF